MDKRLREKPCFITVTAKGEPFAMRLAQLISPLIDPAHVSVDVTPAGVVLSALNDDVLENAWRKIDESLADASFTGPEIRYLHAANQQEPYVKVTVTASEEYAGDLFGCLSSRRGLIQDLSITDGTIVLLAEAPLADMLGYVSWARNLPNGKVTCEMEFLNYRAVANPRDPDPSHVA